MLTSASSYSLTACQSRGKSAEALRGGEAGRLLKTRCGGWAPTHWPGRRQGRAGGGRAWGPAPAVGLQGLGAPGSRGRRRAGRGGGQNRRLLQRWVSLGKPVQTGCASGVRSTAVDRDTGPCRKRGSARTAPSPPRLRGCSWSCSREWRHLWRRRRETREHVHAASPDSVGRAPALGCVPRHAKPCSQQAAPATAAGRAPPSAHLWVGSRSPDLNVAELKDSHLQKQNKKQKQEVGRMRHNVQSRKKKLQQQQQNRRGLQP